MNPLLLEKILQYGILYGPPAIAAIVKLFQTPNPTAEDFAALLTATATTARQQMLAILAQHNVAPESDQGKALLALTP